MFKEAYEYILDNARSSLNTIDLQNVREAVNMIKSAKQIFVYGSGRSGLVGKFFAMRLVQLGLVAYFIGETITPVVNSEDLVILISNTGRTKSTVLVESIAKRIGAKIIAITSSRDTPLAKHANLVFTIKPKNGRVELAPLGTLFEISAVIFLDALIAELMKELNQTEEDMRRRHAIWV
ncbi:iron dicitrate transport regulator FecR [Euryarchaeota archaeon ex4484_178]|nr:MAG: iron dicitrate transport regulator FecR [Euryarchaeota archaeon ex4484_178]